MKNTWKPTCGGYIPSDNDNIVDMKTENKSFPTREEFSKICFDLFTYLNRTQADEIYNYFTQFAVREVFPEVGKDYEFRNGNGTKWVRGTLKEFCVGNGTFTYEYIRPIQSSRLDELKARKSELSKDELLELIELMETTQ